MEKIYFFKYFSLKLSINYSFVLTLELKIINNWKKEHQIIFEKILTLANSPNNEDIQKKKFSLLTELILNLCSNKNYKGDFRNFSSLILLFLSCYKKNYPIDIFSKGKSGNSETEKTRLEFKCILKRELRNNNPIP